MTGIPTLDPCVHCGFCLQACPTYVATGDEADGPRGRIVLMQALQRGHLDPADPDARYHLDRCLGCRACETACPSGVGYGEALEQTRAEMLPTNPTPAPAGLTLGVMAEPRVRAPVLAVARMVRPIARWFAGPSPWRFGLGSLAATRFHLPQSTDPPTPTPAVPSHDAGTAVVFRGCIMDGLFRHVNDATARTLAVNGFRDVAVADQGCCGALHAHAGHLAQARDLARANVRAFRDSGADWIAVNSAGCGAMLKGYGHLLAHDPLAEAAHSFAARVRDVTELLARTGPLPGAPIPLRVAYDAPCHLQHAQRVTDAPEAVLNAVPGLERVYHPESDACCGSAGLYSLVQRELSRAVLDRKIRHLVEARPDVIVTGNPGCTMHIGAGLLAAGHRIAVVHPVELLDESYRRANSGGAG